jgi:integrase
MTFTELATEWLAQKGHLDETSKARYQAAVAELSEYLTKLPATWKMTELVAEIAEWEQVRRAELSPTSFNLELAILRHILQHGVEAGYIERNPAQAYKPSKRTRQEKPVPTPEQFDKLVKRMVADGGQDAAWFVEFLAYSGCRESEARAVRWSDVDWERNRILIGRGGNTKNGREYWLPLFKKLHWLLTVMRSMKQDIAPDDAIFGSLLLRYRLTKACKALKLPLYSHHTFRHYFAVQALKTLGIGKVAVVAKFMNPSDGGRLILELYGNHVTEKDIEDCASQL